MTKAKRRVKGDTDMTKAKRRTKACAAVDWGRLIRQQKRRWLKSYITHGAITDVVKCEKAARVYWSNWRGCWKRHSAAWRQSFANASVLACGISLFHGGENVHPCGDPESRWNIRWRSVGAYNMYVKGRKALFPCAEAVRLYRRNIIGDRKRLIEFGGLEYYMDHLKGIRYAARIFGVKLCGKTLDGVHRTCYNLRHKQTPKGKGNPKC